LSGYLSLGQELSKTDNLNGESFNFGPAANYNHTVEKILKDLSKYWKIDNFSQVYKITDNIKFHEAGLLKLNCDKALFKLKWLPTLDYKELIEFTGSWYYQFYQNQNDMLSYTLSQVKKYEELAVDKKLKWAT